MLRTGREHLETLRDGRVVYIGSEKVTDVCNHPAFRNAARTVAGIYDLKRLEEHRHFATSDAQSAGSYSSYYLQPRSREDLRKRTRTHRLIADATYGMWGRSIDHVSSFITAMAMRPDVFARKGAQYGDNIVAFYERMRAEDAYASYAITPPQGARDPEFYQRQNLTSPTLRIVGETDDGIVISGMKMLATGGVFANYVFVGSILPLAPNQIKESVTCMVPVGAPGVTLWTRKPLEREAKSEFEAPLTWRFDETDSMLMCANVKIPWEWVFTLDDPDQARGIYIETPAHSFGNHQSNVRFHSKLKLIAGLASRIAQSSGADQVPSVREGLGRLASLEAALDGMIHGQIECAEDWGNGYIGYNRRVMYAALNWCTENYSPIIDSLRELCGGGVFQMPADISVLEDPVLAEQFETFFRTPQMHAKDRMKLFKLAWDVVGSEFAGRHQSYEKFYAGAGFVVKNYNYREAPWDAFRKIVDDLLDSYDVPPQSAQEATQLPPK
jgi:4-hydroxyphenylacetate 3-monooxygenase